MELKATRASAIGNLEDFVENNLGEYSKLRNFDFGPNKRSNTSCLSPYITHGVINEKEVIRKSLDKFSFQKMKNLFKKFYGELIGRGGWNFDLEYGMTT